MSSENLAVGEMIEALIDVAFVQRPGALNCKE
jgi:hypothetical protein